MSLCSDIITAAYRETNLVPRGATPTAIEVTEALPLLNSIILNTMGFEAGEMLKDIVIDGEFDQSDLIVDYIPDDCRLVVNLSESDAGIVLGLDPYPYEGQRVAIADTGNIFATYPVTLEANGRMIEGLQSVTLDTDGLTRQWMYRGDTGNWVRVSTLTEDDAFPFPEDFDGYFIIMLAMRINPRHGVQMAPESLQMLARDKTRIRSRYRKTTARALSDPGILSPQERIRNSVTTSEEAFDLGRP